MIQGGAICHQYVYIYTVWLNFSHSLSENKCNSFTKAEFLFCSPAAECSNSGSPQSQLQPQLLCDTSVFFSKPFSLKLQWYTIKNRRGNQKTKRQCAYFKYPRLALCRHVLVSFLFEFPCPRCVELLAYLERKMKTPSFLQVICSLECCFHSCWLTNVLWSDLRPFGLTIPMTITCTQQGETTSEVLCHLCYTCGNTVEILWPTTSTNSKVKSILFLPAAAKTDHYSF